MSRTGNKLRPRGPARPGDSPNDGGSQRFGSLRWQFAAGMLALCLCFVMAGVATLQVQRSLASEVESLLHERVTALQATHALLEGTLRVQVALNDLLRAGSVDEITRLEERVGRWQAQVDAATTTLAARGDMDLLSLHENSQLFRNGVVVLAKWRERSLVGPVEADAPLWLAPTTHAVAAAASDMVDAAQVQARWQSRQFESAVEAQLRALDDQRRATFAVAMLSLLAASWVGYVLLGRRVIARLAAISRALRTPQGQAWPTLPVGDGDEIGDMSSSALALLRDREALRGMRDALDAQRRHLEAILDGTADAILVLQSGRVEKANPAAHRMFSAPPDGLRGLPATRLLPQLDLAGHAGLASTAMPAVDTMAQTERGSLPVEATLSHLGGEPRVSIVVLRDATLRRETTRYLEEARRSAEAARHSQSRFLATVTHELRTPLNAILGFSELLLKRGGLPEHEAHWVQHIDQGGHHLLSLIEDLLDLASIEAGRFSLDPGPIDPRVVTGAVMSLLRERAPGQPVALQCHIADEVPARIVVDEKRLRQVLLNLMGNALKFTREGEVVLEVTLLRATPDAEPRLRFAVSDTGVGIEPEDLQRIFQPFEQAGPSRDRSRGTGLGLAISKELLLAMGSRIEANSVPGRGSRFWFDLPLETPAAASAGSAVGAALAACAAGSPVVADTPKDAPPS